MLTHARGRARHRAYRHRAANLKLITGGDFIPSWLADYEVRRAVNVDAIYLPPDLPRSPAGPQLSEVVSFISAALREYVPALELLSN